MTTQNTVFSVRNSGMVAPGMGVIPDWHPIDYSPDDVYMCHSLSRRRQQLGGILRLNTGPLVE